MILYYISYIVYDLKIRRFIEQIRFFHVSVIALIDFRTYIIEYYDKLSKISNKNGSQIFVYNLLVYG